MRLIDADALHTHKFLTPQVKVIGGRHNGKTREQIIEAYQKGWNDCIDAIVDNAPTVDVISNDEGYEMYGKGYLQGYERGKAEITPHGERAEGALLIIDRLYIEGHISNTEQGILRRAILLPEKGGAE